MRGAIAVVYFGLGLAPAPACASDDQIDTVFDPCSPLTIAVPSDDAAEVQAVAHAVDAWRAVLPAAIEVANAPGDGALTIRFESGDTFYRAMYWDTIGVISVSRDGLAPGDYAIAIAHELGHAFGLAHVGAETRPSVMNVGNLDVWPNGDDAGEVQARWESCRR